MRGRPVAHTKVAELQVMLAEVSAETFVSVENLKNRSRVRCRVDARKLFIRRAADAGYGCWSIARALGKDHTTILHHLGRLA